MTRYRAGPLRFGETTYDEAKRWFGEPSDADEGQVGCVRAVTARWGRKLTGIFVTETSPGIVEQVTVATREMTSSEHGVLRFETKRGLRVGDTLRRLKRLYPRAVQPDRHRNKIHFVLRGYGRESPRLVATVDKATRRVTELTREPFEFC